MSSPHLIDNDVTEFYAPNQYGGTMGVFGSNQQNYTYQLDVRSEATRVKSTLVRRMTAEGWALQDDSAYRMVFGKQQGSGSMFLNMVVGGNAAGRPSWVLSFSIAPVDDQVCLSANLESVRPGQFGAPIRSNQPLDSGIIRVMSDVKATCEGNGVSAVANVSRGAVKSPEGQPPRNYGSATTDKAQSDSQPKKEGNGYGAVFACLFILLVVAVVVVFVVPHDKGPAVQESKPDVVTTADQATATQMFQSRLAKRGYRSVGETLFVPADGQGGVLDLQKGACKSSRRERCEKLFMAINGNFLGADTLKPSWGIEDVQSLGTGRFAVTYLRTGSVGPGQVVNYNWTGEKIVAEGTPDTQSKD
jgi:hypothetical protein